MLDFAQRIIQIIQLILQFSIVLTFFDSPIGKVRVIVSSVFVQVVYSLMIGFVMTHLSFLAITTYSLLFFISCWLIHKKSLLKSFSMACLQMLLSACVDYIGQLLYVILGADITEILNRYNRLGGRIAAVVILAAIFLVCKRMQIGIKILYKSGTPVKYGIIYLFYLLLYTLPNIVYYERYLQESPSGREVYNLILFITFFVYSFLYVLNVQKAVDLKQQLKVQTLYSDTLERMNSELRSFKHDFANIINTINGNLELNDIDSAKKCLNNLNLKMLKNNTTDIVNGQLKQIPMLYGVLLSKLQLAELNAVEFSIAIMHTPVFEKIDQLDISRIVGVFLDNALEATIQCEHKFIHMDISLVCDRTHISITNTCPHNVDTQLISQKGYTTKEGHPGVGLVQVYEILRRYQQRPASMELLTSCENNMFTQTLVI